MKKTTLYLSTAAVALAFFASEAWAQGQAPAAADDASSSLEEIVVTAQRRAERLQDVPIAVTALSSDQAAALGVTDTRSLIVAVPGLDFNTNGPNGAAPFLRGVGSASSVGGQESPVAMFVDGVYRYAPAGNLQSLPYVDLIEVLKGPQGTLFGRNATAGVVQVTTRDPGAEPAIEASVGYGAYATSEGSLYASTPITDALSANLVLAGSNQEEGWGRNVNDGSEVFLGWNWQVRAKLQWKPSDVTRVLLAAEYSRREDDFGINFQVPPGVVGLGGQLHPGDYNSSTSSRDFSRVTDYGASLRVEHRVGDINLLSISAYRSTTNRLSLDQEGIAAPLIKIDVEQPAEQFSQEFQLQSAGDGPLEWVAGMFFMDANSAYSPLALSGLAFPPGGAPITNAKQDLQSWSAFAQATYPVLERTDLTLGVRYTSDEYEVRGRTQFDPAEIRGSDSSSKVTYRVAIDHKITDDLLVYVSQSRGFKSGAFNTLRYDQPAVSPEILDATEIGIKSEFLDGKARLNAAAYHYDYSNLQVLQVAVGAAYAINAGQATINGVDVDFALKPIRNLTLTAGLAYMDGEYDSFPKGAINTPAGPAGNLQTVGDLAGYDTIRTPKLTVQLAAVYDIETSNGTWTLAANYYHNYGYFWEPDNRMRQPRYHLVNASASWQSPSERFGVRLWGKNLTDELYYSYGAETPFGDEVSPAAPRTFGVTVSFKN